jgi:hypothetical protein
MTMYFRKKQSQPIQVVRRDACRLRMSEWRANLALVREAGDVLNTTTARTMIDVVRNESPANIVLLGVPIEERAVMQARIEGYQMALTNLEALAEFEQPKEQLPEPTFESPQ